MDSHVVFMSGRCRLSGYGRFMQPEQAVRRGQYDAMELLKERFDTHMESLTAGAPASFINEKRAAILSVAVRWRKSFPGFSA